MFAIHCSTLHIANSICVERYSQHVEFVTLFSTLRIFKLSATQADYSQPKAPGYENFERIYYISKFLKSLRSEDLSIQIVELPSSRQQGTKEPHKTFDEENNKIQQKEVVKAVLTK